MTETGQLKSRIILDNGLTLEIWDRSRPVAGDRWQVTMEARINIPLRENFLAPSERHLSDRIRAALGPEVLFCQQKVRNFIAVDQVPQVFEGLQRRFLQSTQTYLGHRDFPGKFILKKFSEYQEEQAWRKS
ncbi:MAG: hypothetical protein ACLFUU_00185 [Desulfobacteraceae bacterium]